MCEKDATQVKSVSFPNSRTYRFYGFTFELPADLEFHSIEISNRLYIAHTSSQDITLKPCSKCKRLLQMHSFYQGKAPCKKCHMLLVKSWQKHNPEKAKVHKKKCNHNYRYKQKLISAGLL